MVLSEIVSRQNSSAEVVNEESGQIENFIFRLNHKYWTIPGQGKVRRDTCGSFRSAGYDVVLHKLVFKFNHCYSRDCPQCYKAWASRQANVTASKLYVYGSLEKRKFYHFIFSPKQEKHYTLTMMKKDKLFITKLLNKIQFSSVIVFHPARNKDEIKHQDAWYISPHFHVISDCSFIPSKKVFNESGWVIKRINSKGITEFSDLYTLMAYELGHCGISKEQPSALSVFYTNEFSSRKNKFLSLSVNMPMYCCNNDLSQLPVVKVKIANYVFENLSTYSGRKSHIFWKYKIKYQVQEQFFMHKMKITFWKKYDKDLIIHLFHLGYYMNQKHYDKLNEFYNPTFSEVI